MAIDPVDAALDALAAYFAGLDGIADAFRGWPERDKDLDLTGGPVVSVVRASDQRTECPPNAVNDAAPWLWRVGDLTITAQVDLWAAYRAQRDDAALVIQDALHNDLPWRNGLYLTSAGYHDRPLTCLAGLGRSDGEPNASTVGEWRRTWMVTITTDLVVETATPTLTSATIRDEGGDEPDITVT